MRAAEKKSTEECPVKMKLVAPPLYVLTTNVRLLYLLFCSFSHITQWMQLSVPLLYCTCCMVQQG